MQQAVLPLCGYVLLQLFVLVIGLNVARDKDIGLNGLLKAWIFGQMICFAVFQILALPMIVMRQKFNLLLWTYIGACMLLFILGCLRLRKCSVSLKIGERKLSWLSIIILIATIVLILYQSGTYFFGIHLDEDDARWLAQANDALVYGDMFTRNYDTGEFGSYFYLMKDVTSPCPMMWAVVSRVLFTSPAIFAHTLYPPVEVLLMYGIYWLIGAELTDKLEGRLTFILLVALLNLFMGETVYTQSVFSLIRIWQGKATVAGVIIPFLLYCFLCLNKRKKSWDWLKVLITGTAATLMSGMGIVLPTLMIGVYGAYYVIAYQKWKQIPFYMVSMLPAVTVYMINVSLKG